MEAIHKLCQHLVVNDQRTETFTQVLFKDWHDKHNVCSILYRQLEEVDWKKKHGEPER